MNTGFSLKYELIMNILLCIVLLKIKLEIGIKLIRNNPTRVWRQVRFEFGNQHGVQMETCALLPVHDGSSLHGASQYFTLRKFAQTTHNFF